MLTPEHQQFLDAAAISRDMQAGIESTDDGIRFPLSSITGRVLWQFRPDEPGDGPKYRTTPGEELVLPVPPGMQERVDGVASPLVIVEGTKGHLAMASALADAVVPGTEQQRYAVVGLLGCYGWMSNPDGEPGQGSPIADLFAIPMEGRQVFLALDADLTTNRSVWDAASELEQTLTTVLGAESVSFIVLPGSGSDGLDDVLARVDQARRQALAMRLVDRAVTRLPRRPAANRNPFVSQGGLQVADLFDALERRHRMAVTADQTIAVYKNGRYWNGKSREFGASVIELLGNEYRKSHEETTLEYSLNRLVTNGRMIPDRPGRPLINVANGLLDLETLTLHPHDPSYLSVVQFPVEWDENAQAPAYEDWLASSIQGGEAQVAAIEETAAQMLDPMNVPTKAAFLFGPTRSGKSTFLNLAAALAGKQNMSSVSLHDLATNAFAAAEVYGRILNICADLSSAHVRDTSLFKQLLGEDLVQGNKKYGQMFSFRNNALFMFSANEIPTVGEGSGAYLARMRPFQFPTSHLGREDLSLKGRLMAEMPGIFRRWVMALLDHQARGGFLSVDHSVGVEFETGSDAIRAFVAERTVPDESGTQAAVLYAEYEAWCRRTGRRAMSVKSFGERLKDGDVVRWEKRKGANYYLVRIVAAGAIDLSGPDPSRGAQAPQLSVTDSDAGSDSERHTPDVVEGVEGYSQTVRLSNDSNSPSEKVSREAQCQTPSTPSTTLHQGGVREPVIFDLETTGVEGLHTDEPGFVRIVGVEDAGSVEVVDPAIGDKVLSGYLEDGHPLVAHNGMQFDFLAMQRRGVLDVLAHGDAGCLIDSKVLALLNDPPTAAMRSPRRYYGLDETAQRVAGIGKTDDLKALAKEFGGFDKIPVDDERYVEYCRGDVVATRAMFDRLEMSEYAKREMRVMARLSASITGRGFRVDLPLLEQRLEAGRVERESRIQWLGSEVGLPTDGKAPAATKAGKELLDQAFADRGVTLPRTPAGDAPSLSKDTLADLIREVGAEYPEAARLAEAVLALNGVRTVYKTVSDHLVGDRVHPEVNAFQASGRFSVTNPGLTVFGKRGGKHVEREVFLPEPGEVLVAFDLNQIDARAIAMHCQDPGYMALFQDASIDSHTEIAKMVFGDAARREESKAIAHSWNYGAGTRSIAAKNGLPEATVLEFDQAMRAQFPVLVTWRDEIRKRAESGALLDNGFGRMMRPEADRAWTQGPALMGQGLARDLLAEGILRLPLEAVARLKAVIHDELVFSIPAADVEGFKAVVLGALEFEHMNVPVTAGFEGQGVSWGHIYRKGE